MKRTVLFLVALFLAQTHVFSQGGNMQLTPEVHFPVYFDISPPLRNLMKKPPVKYDNSWKDGIVKNYFNIKEDSSQQPGFPEYMDPGLQDYLGDAATDTTIQNFPGVGNVGGYVPPDTEGDVGPNHYFQVINCSYAIFNKSGVIILGPLNNSSVWSGMPNNSNDGDAIVLYDEAADRWIFTQFSLPNYPNGPFFEMIAVSQTPDPTGTWYRYQYQFSQMPDYPKFGIWPDGYYMSCNRYSSSFEGVGADAFDRAAMLAGSPTAARISFTLPSSNPASTMLPSDCDGPFPPAGTPNYFTYVLTSGSQSLGIYEFHADFTTPANSTFGNSLTLPVNSFSTFPDGGWYVIPQQGTTMKLDALSDRLMCRLQYMKFNSYASMVVNHTVKIGMNVAGIRWYELRNSGSGWTLYQQSTYAPADGKSRWMGSMALDSAGNIALGYSISSSTMYPSIYYTGRKKNDPLNQMTLTEKGIINGGGAQTYTARWGDYSAMRLDPTNYSTFWYTQEYYTTTSSLGWKTRIASFSFSDIFSTVASATPTLVCQGDSSQLWVSANGGSGTYTYSWSSIPAGFTSSLQNPKVAPADTMKYVATTTDGLSTLHDTVQVNVMHMPVVSAGTDTIVCWYVTSIDLHGMASNYKLIGWTTNGSGTFANASLLETTYNPNLNDKLAGSVDLKLVADANLPCTGNVTGTKHVVFDACTGIAGQNNMEPSLTIRPNPAHGSVAITMSGITNNPAVLTIISVDGKTIFKESFETDAKQVLKQLDISGYAKGPYFVQLKTDRQVTAEKMIVQ